MQVNLLQDVWQMRLETLHGIMYRAVDVSYRQFFYTTKSRFVRVNFNEQNSLFNSHMYKALPIAKITYVYLCWWHLLWPLSIESFRKRWEPLEREQYTFTSLWGHYFFVMKQMSQSFYNSILNLLRKVWGATVLKQINFLT